jgi:hypothetical protein
MLVVASKVPVVNPVSSIIDDPVAFVKKMLETVVFVLTNCADVILVAIILDVLKVPVIFNDVLVKLTAEILVADKIPVEILVVANNVPVVKPPVKLIDVELILVNRALEIVILFAAIFAAVILPVANKVPVVNPPLNIIEAPLALVNNTLLLVRFTVETFALVKLVKLPLPFTSNVYAGAVVPIPTFPPVVKIDPIVLLFPIALKLVPTNTDPADIFVSTKLVVVILTTVRVPPIFRLPDKLIEPPDIVVALINELDTVLNDPSVEYTDPDVRVVLTKLVKVEFVALRVLVVILVVFKLVVVILDTTNDVAVKLVITPFETVIFVALINSELIEVVANKVEVVILVFCSEPVVNVPVIRAPPDTSNVNAGAVVPKPTLPLV